MSSESMFTFDFEDFSDSSSDGNTNNIIKYDKMTSETYRVKRLLKIDPITDEHVSENLIFYYPHKWDPYTGQIIGTDEIGPLAFNAINLYKFYFKNRLSGLWIPPSTEGTEHYQGYYGNLVGAGKNINIDSRGEHPEKYLFRIPIIDCYLPINHNLAIITMGPILSDKEISIIDQIVFKNLKTNVSLKQIKDWYDSALDNTISILELRKKYPRLNNYNDIELKDYHNRLFVNKLMNCNDMV